ncbi:hypothetical protein TNCV_4896261 [Trichonephila clavipes]|uniref:Uncharacterized protein n=1 Tax=Trichonephila clavipes TaxID=2585209 RepID=A0A8X6VWU8_TRICX|nr:hypothetical protein TNCV_4896261 [Trichonephila clavipes]
MPVMAGYLNHWATAAPSNPGEGMDVRECLVPPRHEGRPRQVSRREDRHIVRNVRVQPTASSATIQAQVEPSLGAPVSSQIIRRGLAEVIWDRGTHYMCCP